MILLAARSCNTLIRSISVRLIAITVIGPKLPNQNRGERHLYLGPPHVPVWDKSARSDGTFSRADFVFDQGRNIYVCPGGAELTSTGNIDQGHIVYYRASKNDCSRCSLKPKCTTATVRKITRDLNEDVRDRVRALANTEASEQSRRERKKVEMRFAHMKRILRLDRFRLRGLTETKSCSRQPHKIFDGSPSFSVAPHHSGQR